MSISKKLKEARKASKMTQGEAAKKLGITNTTLSNWENDVSKPDVDMIKKICKLYKVNPNDLYDWETLWKVANNQRRIADCQEFLLPLNDEDFDDLIRLAQKLSKKKEK